MRTGVSLFVAIGLTLGAGPVFAGSATWLQNPGSSDWNTAGNWTPDGPPNGAADTATFQSSTVRDLSISADTRVNGITFSTGGSTLYTITASPTFALTISGLGITNNSGITQNFVAAGNNGVIQFANSATAGFNTAFTTNGGAVSGEVFGITEFRDSSNAGNATFTTNSGTVNGAFGGVTQFFDTSTAGNGTFINNGRTVSGAGSGLTLFFNSSTAGNGTFINNGTAISGESGSFIVFFDTSSAGNGTFTNNGGSALRAHGGATQFFDNSTAGSGTFVINGGAVSGGDGAVMQFFNNATAANGTFTTNGGAISGLGGGTIEFRDSSSAGNGTFTTNGITANFAGPGNVRFSDSSTAGNATFITNGGGTNGAGGGGGMTFADNSSAGTATFTINGTTRSDGSGGTVEFRFSSSAANGTFITNGSAFRTQVCPTEICGGDLPVPYGALNFFESSTAANATLIANGGTDGGDGGLILFGADSTGGTARVEVFGNGSLDIGIHNGPDLTIGSLEGTGTVFLGFNNLIVGSNNLSTLFSGVIHDGGINGDTGGSLTKIGGGTMILNGVNTYTGVSNINGGVLQVDGSIISNTFINPGGVLAGIGTIFANAINSGVVSPGNSPGTLLVKGNYTQNANGTLQIEIAGLAPAQHDLLQAGTANLDGTLQLVRLNNFKPQPGDMVPLLIATGGVNGTFADIDSDFTGTILAAEVVYQSNAVLVEFVQGLFGRLPGLTPNQQAVAENLDTVVNDPRVGALIDFLDTEPLGVLPNDFDLVAPEELASIYEIAVSHATVQSINLQRRLDDIRVGSNGFCANGFAITGKDYDRGKISDGPRVSEKNPAPVLQPSPENRWGVFITGVGEFINVGDEDFNARGFDITTGDFTLGLDYRVTPNFAAGINGGYARSEADLVDTGRVTVGGGKLGIYATYFIGGFYFDAAANGGWNNYDTRRTALLDDARGETNGAEVNAFIAAGYDWKLNCLSFGPVASFQYTTIDINEFTEDGSLAPLHFPDQDEDAARSRLGFKIAHDSKLAREKIVRCEARATWQHEFSNDSYLIDSNFASGAGSTFPVHGPETGRDSALVGAGVSLQWNKSLSTYLSYDGQFRDNYESHAVSGGLRVSF